MVGDKYPVPSGKKKKANQTEETKTKQKTPLDFEVEDKKRTNHID